MNELKEWWLAPAEQRRQTNRRVAICPPSICLWGMGETSPPNDSPQLSISAYLPENASAGKKQPRQLSKGKGFLQLAACTPPDTASSAV